MLKGRKTGEKKRSENVLYPALLLLLGIPWLLVHPLRFLNSDIAWLLEAGSRFMAGGTMAGAFYETNPPLSFLIYIPVLLADKLLGLPSHYGIFIYTLGLAFLSCLALWHILKSWPFITRPLLWCLIGSFIFSQTILSAVYFGERDQLLGFGLVPLAFLQLSLTFGRPVNRFWQWGVLLVGALLLMLKPHFGLLPAILLCHRALYQKRVSLWRDADFIVLAGVAIGYGVAIALFFPDYVSTILPDVMALYLPQTEPETYLKGAIYLTVTAVFGILSLSFRGAPAERHFTAFLFLAAFICILPYVIQGRGYFYHLLPSFGFFIPGLGCFFFLQARPYMSDRNATFVTLTIGALLLYGLSLPNPRMPTHRDLANHELSRMITDCRDTCSFFMFNSSLELIHQLSYYTGQTHASRFPALWFLPGLVKDGNRMEPAQQAALINKYTAMVGDDFEKYKPELLLIGRFKIDGETVFDFPAYFSKNKTFAAQWRHYTRTGSYHLNMLDFYPGTTLENEKTQNILITYDIYRRRS